MKALFFAGLLALAPCLAHAANVFQISCENVEWMDVQNSFSGFRVAIALNPAGAKAFEEFTAARVGQNATVMAGELEIITTTVQARIESGRLSGRAMNWATGRAMAEQICPGRAIEVFQVNCENVASIRIVENPEAPYAAGSPWGVLVQLNTAATRTFKDYTERQVGGKIQVASFGPPLLSTAIHEPITSGQFTIGTATKAEALSRIPHICEERFVHSP